jgi:hypothetical protein
VPPAGIEPATPTSERPQTHALDRAATGIGSYGIRSGALEVNVLLETAMDIRSFEMVSSSCPETSGTQDAAQYPGRIEGSTHRTTDFESWKRSSNCV